MNLFVLTVLQTVALPTELLTLVEDQTGFEPMLVWSFCVGREENVKSSGARASWIRAGRSTRTPKSEWVDSNHRPPTPKVGELPLLYIPRFLLSCQRVSGEPRQRRTASAANRVSGWPLIGVAGVEPTTSCPPGKRATNCATPRFVAGCAGSTSPAMLSGASSWVCVYFRPATKSTHFFRVTHLSSSLGVSPSRPVTPSSSDDSSGSTRLRSS